MNDLFSDDVSDEASVLRSSPFFTGLAPAHLDHLWRHARVEVFGPGDRVIAQGEPARQLSVLLAGKLELSFRRRDYLSDRDEQYDRDERYDRDEQYDRDDQNDRDEDCAPDEAGQEVTHGPPHVVSRVGLPVGWASVVPPYRYRGTAVALTPVRMLVIDRDVLDSYARQEPGFALGFMERVLWLMSRQLRVTRTRVIAHTYDSLPASIEALLDQHGPTLSVASPLHKLPHYLKHSLTVDDAFRTLRELEDSTDATEREVATQVSEVLHVTWDELRIHQRLQAIYELVANAPPAMATDEIRRRSAAAFADLFTDTEHRIVGAEKLPDEPGHIIIMNHLANHSNNVFVNRFVLTLDTHFVSSMILLPRYGTPPIRVVRKSDPGEYGHQRYFDRLGYIYVYSGHVDPTDGDPHSSPEQRRRLFLDTAAAQLRAGRNVVICPEGTSTTTEKSPVPFKAGAFRLAAYVRPEPLLVPIAVANFDKNLARVRTVAVVHDPIRLSDHVPDPVDSAALHRFVNTVITDRFTGYVREAARLAR